MIDEFRPRFFDLDEFPLKEVELSPDKAAAYDWGSYYRHLTRVRWDPEIDFVIEVGDPLRSVCP